MQYRDILNAAIRILGESDANGNTSDYEERSAYLLGIFCADCVSLDMKHRKLAGETVSKPQIPACVSLDDTFPLSDVFVPTATYYLASMLVLEENEKISDKLFEEFSDSLCSIRAELCAISHSIKNKYPLA